MLDQVAEIVKRSRLIRKLLRSTSLALMRRKRRMPFSDIDIAVILDEPEEEVEAEIGSLYSKIIDLVLSIAYHFTLSLKSSDMALSSSFAMRKNLQTLSFLLCGNILR